MSDIRIIPRLDIKGPNVVKGIHMEGLRVVGIPHKFARMYYEQGADELIYMDVVASLYGRNSLLKIIEKTAKEIFIPLTVGGGLRTIRDIREVLRAGADKVSLNTAAISRPELIQEAAKNFGSSTVVVSIEAIRHVDGHYEAFTDNGRNETGRNVLDWAKQVCDLGAGEIMITSIDKEGTGKGYDIDLISSIVDQVPIPVVASGGGGRKEDVLDLLKSVKVNGVGIASLLHYDALKELTELNDFDEEGNIEFLRGNREFSKINPIALNQLKSYLNSNGVTCRSQ